MSKERSSASDRIDREILATDALERARLLPPGPQRNEALKLAIICKNNSTGGPGYDGREAAEAMRLTARGYHRVLRVARTLADLDGADKVGRVHLAEALSYRALTDEIRRAA